MSEVIVRDELVHIVGKACDGIADSTTERLLAVAKSTDAVAVGHFHCNGVTCPMRQAGRRTNQRFQEAFDRLMGARFGRAWDDDKGGPPWAPFVVQVVEPDIAVLGEQHEASASTAKGEQ